MNDEQIEEIRTKYGFNRFGIIEGELFLPAKEVFEKLIIPKEEGECHE